MATGDLRDIARRLQSVLPPSWTSNPAPNLSAVLQAPASGFSQLYGLITFAKAQTRLSTASGIFIDLISFDLFGRGFIRKPSQPDASFSAAVKNRLLTPRQTRAGLVQSIENLTNASVKVFEPWNANDTGGFGAQWAFCEPRSAWGSTSLPYQMLVSVAEPLGTGIPDISGFGNTYSGFGAGSFFFADVSLVKGAVTNQDIYDEINAVRAAGVTVWTDIVNPPPPGARLDMDFVIGSSILTDLPQDVSAPTEVASAQLGEVLIALIDGRPEDLGLVTELPPAEADDLGAVTSGRSAIIDLGTVV